MLFDTDFELKPVIGRKDESIHFRSRQESYEGLGVVLGPSHSEAMQPHNHIRVILTILSCVSGIGIGINATEVIYLRK